MIFLSCRLFGAVVSNFSSSTKNERGFYLRSFPCAATAAAVTATTITIINTYQLLERVGTEPPGKKDENDDNGGRWFGSVGDENIGLLDMQFKTTHYFLARPLDSSR